LKYYKTEKETEYIFKKTFARHMKGASMLIILANIDQIEKLYKTFMWDVELLLKKSEGITIIVTKQKEWDYYSYPNMK